MYSKERRGLIDMVFTLWLSARSRDYKIRGSIKQPDTLWLLRWAHFQYGVKRNKQE